MARRGPSSRAGIDALAELARAPRRVMLRAVERLEQGLAALQPDASVPAGWFLSTASGYAIESRGRLDGAVVIADASVIIERLSAIADHRDDELPSGALGLSELAERWGVSERTVLRYRHRGLAARSVRSQPNRRLAFTPFIIEAFEQRDSETVDRARRFTRLTERECEHAISWGAALQGEGESLSSAARTIANELGRSHESIRQLLLKRAERSDAWTEPQRRLAVRAFDRFIEPARIASRLGKDTTATRRMIDAQRLHRLRALELPDGPADPVAPRDVPLGAPGPTVLADLVAEMRDAAAPDRALERELTAAARGLTIRAARTIDGQRASKVRAEPIDAAETDLRWAARLRVEALRPMLGIVLRSVEARLGDPIETLPARVAATRLLLAIAAAAEAAHRYDPARGGRLSAAVNLAVDHAFSESPLPAARPASARRTFTQSPVDDWTRRVSPWQSFLEAPRHLRAGLASIPADQRALLEARFGFGEHPCTLAELADRFDIHRPWIARRVREAARAAIEAGRSRHSADSIGT